jgi:hypothetical protein
MPNTVVVEVLVVLVLVAVLYMGLAQGQDRT